MKGFYKKTSIDPTCMKLFLKKNNSPHRVHHASSLSADPPLPSSSDVIYLRSQIRHFCASLPATVFKLQVWNLK